MVVRLTGERSFGELLRRFRGEEQLTQAGLAERSGVGLEAIRSLEAGRRKAPREATVRAIADALHLDDARRTALKSAANGGRDDIPRELPADIQDFTGRERELRTLTNALQAPGVTRVTGQTGSGKTALVVHAAHQLSFADGVLYLTSPRSIESAARMLIVLDDLGWGDISLRDKVIDAARSAAIVIISREPLQDVAIGGHISLGGLPAPDALRLLCRISGAEPWASEPEVATRIIELCEGMPGTLRRVGARAVGRPSWSATDLLGWLISQRNLAGIR